MNVSTLIWLVLAFNAVLRHQQQKHNHMTPHCLFYGVLRHQQQKQSLVVKPVVDLLGVF